MTNPATPGGQPYLTPAAGVGSTPVRVPPVSPLVTALLLVLAGGLAIGGSFGTLDEEAEQAGAATITLSYTSWRLAQGGTYDEPVYFHAPHFGIPLLVAGLLVIAGGLLLVTGRGRLAAVARPLALASAGLLVGAVWTVGLVVSADLDAVARGENFELTWSTGSGFWLILAGGVAAAAGGLLVLFGRQHIVPDEPVTPRYGFPAIGGPAGPPDASVPFIPPQAHRIDPLSGQPITPRPAAGPQSGQHITGQPLGGHPGGSAVLPVFQQPLPPQQPPADLA